MISYANVIRYDLQNPSFSAAKNNLQGWMFMGTFCVSHITYMPKVTWRAIMG